jgi:two-component system, response regulator
MILIVDDSPIDIELTQLALEAIGSKASFHSAPDGKSALAMLRNGRVLPALILLDLKMPGMGGIEVLRAIRADDRFRETPVVVITSSALESDRAEAMAAGASAYIQKPLALHKFSKDLESILHRWLPNVLDTLLKVSVSISITIRKLADCFENPHFCDV